MTQLDIAFLRTWVGCQDRATSYVSPDLVHRFKATFDLKGEEDKLGDAAPLLIHYCLANTCAPTNALGADGHPQKGGFLPPVSLPRRMWAGSNVQFHGPIRVGDDVERVSTIADVFLKEGGSGPLCFVEVEHVISVSGVPVAEEFQTIVYREAAVTQETRPPRTDDVAPQGSHSRPVMMSAPLLFRYSALTFNGHRIHYDRTYAQDVEKYPGLVVHGPLQATLLLQFAEELRGAPPRRFSFRGQQPLFDDDNIVMHATPDGDRMQLWTARAGGGVAMSAEATW